MRFVAGSQRVKRCAKALKRALARFGQELQYNRCLDLASRLYGYKDYSEVVLTEGYWPFSPADEDADDATVEARFSHQEQVMETASFRDIAGLVLDEVNPTARVVAHKSRRERHRN
jgi:hypothetical protein